MNKQIKKCRSDEIQKHNVEKAFPSRRARLGSASGGWWSWRAVRLVSACVCVMRWAEFRRWHHLVHEPGSGASSVQALLPRGSAGHSRIRCPPPLLTQAPVLLPQPRRPCERSLRPLPGDLVLFSLPSPLSRPRAKGAAARGTPRRVTV